MRPDLGSGTCRGNWQWSVPPHSSISSALLRSVHGKDKLQEGSKVPFPPLIMDIFFLGWHQVASFVTPFQMLALCGFFRVTVGTTALLCFWGGNVLSRCFFGTTSKFLLSTGPPPIESPLPCTLPSWEDSSQMAVEDYIFMLPQIHILRPQHPMWWRYLEKRHLEVIRSWGWSHHDRISSLTRRDRGELAFSL